jgi:hypothetical protein
MKSLAAAVLFVPAVVFAASPFDGNWKFRPGSYQASDKPYVFSVDQNAYSCDSCVPPVNVKPDGKYRKVSGHGYDSIAAKIVDPRTVEVTERKAEKVIERQSFTASEDGSQLKVQLVDESGEKPAATEAMLKRGGTQPGKNMRPVSGSWVLAGLDLPTNPTTLRMTAETFSWSLNGQHYEAKFDDAPVPMEGDPTHLSVSLKKLGANEVQETDMRDGKPVYQVVFIASPDGKTITVKETDLRFGHQGHYTLDKHSIARSWGVAHRRKLRLPPALTATPWGC